MTTVEALQAARALIEKGWTQDTYARDTAGNEVCPRDSAACVWCIEGAILAITTSQYLHIAIDKYLVEATGGSAWIRWNDAPERTQADVLAAFDRAIALAKGEEN